MPTPGEFESLPGWIGRVAAAHNIDWGYAARLIGLVELDSSAQSAAGRYLSSLSGVAQGEGRGFVLDGPPTVGKSTLVKAIGYDFERDLRNRARHPDLGSQYLVQTRELPDQHPYSGQ